MRSEYSSRVPGSTVACEEPDACPSARLHPWGVHRRNFSRPTRKNPWRSEMAGVRGGYELAAVHREVARIDERAENLLAPGGIDTEQARGLSERQSKARQLAEFRQHARAQVGIRGPDLRGPEHDVVRGW